MAIKELLYIPQTLFYLFGEKLVWYNMSITSHSRDLSTFLLVDNDDHVVISLQVNYFYSIEVEFFHNINTLNLPTISQAHTLNLSHQHNNE